LFVLAVLLPVSATAWLSLSLTQRVLTDEAREQLRVSAKAYGMSVYNALAHARSELHEIALRLRDGYATSQLVDESDVDWLGAAALWRASAPEVPIKGAIEGGRGSCNASPRR
jgi:hypothetical protein